MRVSADSAPSFGYSLLMAHGPTKYPTKGVSIYRGAVGTCRTDEHIIAKSLGGQHVIDDASYDQCAKITKRFEVKCCA